jgi:quinol monooxygenase YgiN
LVIIFARITVRREKRKELLQTLCAIVEQVRKESGCLKAGVYQDLENENDFLLLEEWATQKDSVDHVRSDIFTLLIGAESLMSRPMEIGIHTVCRSTHLEPRKPRTYARE